jgi:hypothetical protein
MCTWKLLREIDRLLEKEAQVCTRVFVLGSYVPLSFLGKYPSGATHIFSGKTTLNNILKSLKNLKRCTFTIYLYKHIIAKVEMQICYIKFIWKWKIEVHMHCNTNAINLSCSGIALEICHFRMKFSTLNLLQVGLCKCNQTLSEYWWCWP